MAELPRVRVIAGPLWLAALLLGGAVILADPRREGIWLAITIGFLGGLIAGVGWWLWIRRHGLRIPDSKMRKALLGIGLIGAVLLRAALPEWALPTVLACISGATLITAFPPADA
jgi:hypothetical protein